ncbi:hypothetical protein CRV02_04935 [Arcobacter sp. CECT 8989]|uniref:hypothetical protein n=1 Tax=Arcobacter sp. CECT 8989 TaxID=2044509 RepID=UPI00100C1203|nr:hypothetical protein [Arcobacter sp. CECT 8989]RXK02195.1 hypothetical protein CRV02_04935 [Arcobacter sp. CECT 8989]
MKSSENLTTLYEHSKANLKTILNSPIIDDIKLLELIDKLTFDNSFSIKKIDDYNLDEIAKVFRFYEELLKKSFNEDKEKFELEFKLYTLLIKVFTELCNTFINDKNKIPNIDNFFQILKESKNMLKLTIPLDVKHINILNNLIGEQLYYFSHIHYHDINAYPLDYTFEKYFLNLEKMFHGYDLSLSSDFGHKEFTNKDIELAILKNNASFLILTLIHKIYKYKSFDDLENNKFKNIIKFYTDNFSTEKDTKKDTIKNLESLLLRDFIDSNKYIKKITNHNLLTEKLILLELDTDEYKQLIDIIKKIDFQD